MGTRGLTMVISEAKTKVAQYGQWDHYFEGQGVTVLEFLRNTDLNKFKERLKDVRFATKKDDKEVEDFFKSIGVEDGWMTGEQADEYHKKYPLLTRDNGAKILNLLMKGKGKVFLQDSTDFVGDSLFCEYAYVIDLDKGVFEVYDGFNKKPLTSKDRFFGLKSDSEYGAVKMVKSFKLSKLPTKKEFLAKLEGKK